MQINFISAPNYANLASKAAFKPNSKSNINFEGRVYLDGRLRKWCGERNIASHMDAWQRSIPDDTSVDIFWTGSSDGPYIDVFKVNVKTPEHNWYYRDLDMWRGGMNDDGSYYDYDIARSNQRGNLARLNECISDCARAGTKGIL